VVKAGGDGITTGTLEHWMHIEAVSRGERATPLPPEYTTCVSALKSELESAKLPALSVAQLMHLCEVRYDEVKDAALGHLVYLHWLLASGNEYGATVTVAEAEAQLRAQNARSKLSAAQLKTLAAQGENEADYLQEIRATMIQEKLRAKVKKSVGPLKQQQVNAYYASHRSSYLVPEERDLQIVRAVTESAALKDKQAIASGQSFAAVVAASHVTQPIYSEHGLVLGLRPGAYSEAPLNDAIFSAKPNVLSGPVPITLGYYVFEVKRIHASYQQSLEAVEASIREELPELLQKEALRKFLERWKKHWTAETTCETGYVIWKCKGSSGTPPATDEPTSFY
jgi:parvulin-like peptidyl-prolyl isomerase